MGIAYLGQLLTIEQFRQLVYGNDLGIYNKVYVHHTAIPTEAQWAGKPMLDNIYNTYESRGWAVGPNLFVAPEGIWHCTPVWMDGIASGDNYQTRQIETVGNYNDHLPSGKILENVVAATGILLQKPTPLGVDAICQHRWVMPTDCPGNMWSANWEWFKGLVQQYMDTHPLAGGVPVPTTPQPTSLYDFYVLIQQNFPEDQWLNAYRVMLGESSGNPSAIGDNGSSIGLFQIRWDFEGRPAREWLLDPTNNITYAGELYSWQGWRPWTVAGCLGLVPGWNPPYTIPDWVRTAQPPAPPDAPPPVDNVEGILRSEAWNAAGVIYNPEAAFAIFARNQQLGNPVTNEFNFTNEGVNWRGQGFQGGIVYAVVGDWQNCRYISW